ncbi:N-glycosylase/DNA lyase [Candidatus Woesearchaeota archaeon]|nr:N-glycosylase/DNA lyase [Candidatus Woesearchaeota archaeon]
MIEEIKRLQKTSVKNKIDSKLKEFSSFKDKDTKEWFYELCFCLLTANSKAKTAMSIQDELGVAGFCTHHGDDVRDCIIKHKHRFHNNKSRFIVEAREHIDIKEKLKDKKDKREWLVNNIKGLGYKEGSHFLKNTGHFDVAILDRHINRLLLEEGYIKEIPKTITPKKYVEIEKIFKQIAKQLSMNCAELDFYMWYIKTGEVLK